MKTVHGRSMRRLPVSSIEVNGNDLTDRHEITLEAANGQVQVQDRQATIDRLIGQLDLGEDDVSFEQLDVVAEGSRAAVTGSIQQFDAPIADFAVKSTLDAMRLAPLAKLAEPLSGVVIVDASAKGPLSTPAINAHVTSSALQFRDLRDVQLDATAAYDLATRRATCRRCRYAGHGAVLSANGNVALDGSQQSRLQADINSLDVGTVMRALRLPYVAATRVDGKLQAEWPGLDYLRAKGTANATLRPTASDMSQSAMPLGGRLVARGDGNRIDTQLARITVPGAEINGRFAVTSQRGLQGQISAHSEDVGRLASSVEAFTGRPAGSLLPTPVSGALDVNARIGGSVTCTHRRDVAQRPLAGSGICRRDRADGGCVLTPRTPSLSRAPTSPGSRRARTWTGALACDKDSRFDSRLPRTRWRYNRCCRR